MVITMEIIESAICQVGGSKGNLDIIIMGDVNGMTDSQVARAPLGSLITTEKESTMENTNGRATGIMNC